MSLDTGIVNRPDDFAAAMREAFDEEGAVHRTLRAARGVEAAPPRVQADYAAACAAALARGTAIKDGEYGRGAFLEAATGVGKTLGYVVPVAAYAVLTGRHAVVATQTLALLEQVVASDGAIAATVVHALTGTTPTIRPLRGMRNFPAESRVRALAAEMAHSDTDVDESDRALLRHLAAYAARGGGTIAAWRAEHGELPMGLRGDDVALYSMCPPEDFEAYHREAEQARGADVIVTSHALLTLHALNSDGDALCDPDGREPDAIVIDEADAFGRAMRDNYTASLPCVLTARRLGQLAQDDRTWPARSRQTFDNAREVMDQFGDFLRGGLPVQQDARFVLLDGYGRHFGRDLRGMLTRTAEALRGAAREIGDNDGTWGDLGNALQEQADLAREAKQRLEAIDDTALDAMGVTYSPVRGYPSLRRVPLRPGVLAGRLWRGPHRDATHRARTVVMTSASLSTPGGGEGANRFVALAREHGWSYKRGEVYEDLCLSLEPADFGRLAFRLAPGFPWPTENTADEADDPAYRTASVFASATARVIARCPATPPLGDNADRAMNTLVLVPSYEAAAAVGQSVAEVRTCIVHERGTTLSACLDQYRDAARQNDGAILITPLAWEGVDLPGLIDHLVIPRLPFPPDDPVARQMIAAGMRRQGHSDTELDRRMYAERVSEMARRVRQGIGRAIRRAEDRALVTVLDPRFPVPEAVRQRELLDRPARPRKLVANALMEAVPRRFRRALDDAAVIEPETATEEAA